MYINVMKNIIEQAYIRKIARDDHLTDIVSHAIEIIEEIIIETHIPILFHLRLKTKR